MIKAVIIDDEPKNVKILTKMIREFCPSLQVAGTADNGKSGIEIIRQVQPQLVFLDIEMPYGNAFDMLDQLQPVDFEVIFVTAFDNYTLKAFRYSALDYLLKPVNIEELKVAVNRATDRIKKEDKNLQKLESLLNFINKQQEQAIQKLALPSGDGLIFVPVENIIYCEAKAGYTHFYRFNEDKIISSRNMKEYEELLPPSLFFRIHNSYIINLNYVTKYHRGRGGFIEMVDGALLEVAIRRKDEFLAKFGPKPKQGG